MDSITAGLTNERFGKGPGLPGYTYLDVNRLIVDTSEEARMEVLPSIGEMLRNLPFH